MSDTHHGPSIRQVQAIHPSLARHCGYCGQSVEDYTAAVVLNLVGDAPVVTFHTDCTPFFLEWIGGTDVFKEHKMPPGPEPVQIQDRGIYRRFSLQSAYVHVVACYDGLVVYRPLIRDLNCLHGFVYASETTLIRRPWRVFARYWGYVKYAENL
jgi:hypothetical protein